MSYSHLIRISRGLIRSVTIQACWMSSASKQKVLVTRRLPAEAINLLRASPKLVFILTIRMAIACSAVVLVGLYSLDFV